MERSSICDVGISFSRSCSQRATVEFVTPRAWASFSWVRSRVLRAAVSSFPVINNNITKKSMSDKYL